jgi:hypothetical protein
VWQFHTTVKLDVLRHPARVLPTAAAPFLLVGAGLRWPGQRHLITPFSCEKGIYSKNQFSNLLPICDRPSTLTSHSICVTNSIF